MSSCYDICVLILLWDTYVSSYYIRVLILLCPHATAYVSSYYYMCVLILLHTCPQACSYARSTAGRASPVVRRADAHKRLSWDALTLTKIKKKMQVEPRLSWDALTLKGVGLTSPRKQFELYSRMHAYLASAQVDGVKVDVQVLIYQ